MKTHTVLNHKKVIRDLIATLPAVYFPLLRINLPFIIFMLVFLSPFLLPSRPWKLLYYYLFSYLIYFACLHPYVQAISIWYTNDYLENRINQLSQYYRNAKKIYLRLFLGHFAVFFRIAVLIFIFCALIIPFAFIAFILGPIIALLLITPAILIITFLSSKFILVPYLVIFTRQDIAKCLVQNRQLIQNNEVGIFLRICLLVLLGIVLTVTLYITIANLSEIVPRITLLAPTLAIYLCQPLLIVYSVIVYRHLKASPIE